MTGEGLFLKTDRLEFTVKLRYPKTVVLSVTDIHPGKEIGTIEWHSSRAQYCLLPVHGTAWDHKRLEDVNRVIGVLMSNRGRYATFDELATKLKKIWALHRDT